MVPVVGQAQPFFAEAVQVRPVGQAARACQVAHAVDVDGVQRNGVLDVTLHCTSARCVHVAPACAGESVQPVPVVPPLELELEELELDELELDELEELEELEELDDAVPLEVEVELVLELDEAPELEDVEALVEPELEPALELEPELEDELESELEDELLVEPEAVELEEEAELDDELESEPDEDDVLVDPMVVPSWHLPATQLWPSGQLSFEAQAAPVVSNGAARPKDGQDHPPTSVGGSWGLQDSVGGTGYGQLRGVELPQ